MRIRCSTEDTRFTPGNHDALVQEDTHATRASRIDVTDDYGWVGCVRKDPFLKESVEHAEDWYLFQIVDAQDEAAIDRTVLPFVQSNGR